MTSALESVGSRKQRFNKVAIDISALVGAGGGYLGSVDANNRVTNGGSYGLFAPFGFQTTYKYVGGMVYPLDLGAYMSNASGTDKVRLADSIRGGALFMVRFSASIPIVLTASADYRPAVGTTTRQVRASGNLALELPLFLIH
jgi:hypothetical protein